MFGYYNCINCSNTSFYAVFKLRLFYYRKNMFTFKCTIFLFKFGYKVNFRILFERVNETCFILAINDIDAKQTKRIQKIRF